VAGLIGGGPTSHARAQPLTLQRDTPSAGHHTGSSGRLDQRNAIKAYLKEYFDRESKLAELLIGRKKDAIERFNVYSGAEFNKEASSGGLELLMLALSIVPEAGALLGVLRSMSKGADEFIGFSERVSEWGARVKEVNEAVKGGVELGKGAKERGEAAGSGRVASEAEHRGKFIANAITDLSDLTDDNTTAFWKQHDAFVELFDGLIDVGLSDAQFNDLYDLVKAGLPWPKEVDKQANKLVSDRFELLLYKKFYADRGMRRKDTFFYPKSKLDVGETGEGSIEQFLGDYELPEKMIEHIANDFESTVPHALEVVFGELYEKTPGQKRKRAKELVETVHDARIVEGMSEAFLGLNN
jgi:hypothetical protein